MEKAIMASLDLFFYGCGTIVAKCVTSSSIGGAA